LRQRIADRFERVRVVRMRWMAVSFEMRPLAECQPSFRVHVPHKIFQDT
jgi:hypothetical protein